MVDAQADAQVRGRRFGNESWMRSPIEIRPLCIQMPEISAGHHRQSDEQPRSTRGLCTATQRPALLVPHCRTGKHPALRACPPVRRQSIQAPRQQCRGAFSFASQPGRSSILKRHARDRAPAPITHPGSRSPAPGVTWVRRRGVSYSTRTLSGNAVRARTAVPSPARGSRMGQPTSQTRRTTRKGLAIEWLQKPQENVG